MTSPSLTQENLVQDALSACLPQLESANHIYVAYSGGLDSHVLLHSLADFVDPSRLTALHVNHQISPDAGQWAEHCRLICRELGINYLCKEVEVSGLGSRENAAREARYQAFEEQLGTGDLIVMAHHADDQAETVLYRLLRRSGPRGLAGMPVTRALGVATLLRPLLTLNQAVLDEYAQGNGLQWIEDESNLDRQFDRNFLRHEIIPQINRRWPRYAESIADTAILCEQAETLNEELAQLDLDGMALRRERKGWSLETKLLADLSDARQANLLRFFSRSKGRTPPGHFVVDEVLHSLLSADENRNPVVKWPDGEWRRYRQRLYLLPLSQGKSNANSNANANANENEAEDVESLPWAIGDTLMLPDGGTLDAAPMIGEGLAHRYGGSVKVSFRRGGERCRPVGRAGSANLKKLFQEFALEPWFRSSVPLIYGDKELIAVGDLWVCEGFQAGPKERGYKMRWHYKAVSALPGKIQGA
ncbi:MAG: tRNA lysidine(34) synthetase TilS [Cellvibrionales bacterium]|nr:MAG: tRNA lysidine(34) synthetase TilS [Cellvibrionales bacterium]